MMYENLTCLRYIHILLITCCFIPLLRAPTSIISTSSQVNRRWPLIIASSLLHILSYTTIDATSSHERFQAILLTTLWAFVTHSLQTRTKLASLVRHPTVALGLLIEALACTSAIALVPVHTTAFNIQCFRAITSIALLFYSQTLFTRVNENSDTGYSWLVRYYQNLPRIFRLAWPKNSINAQFSYLILPFLVIFERLMYRQCSKHLGEILNQLAIDHSVVPWNNVYMWILSNLFSTWGTTRVLLNIIRSHVQQYSRIQLKSSMFSHFMDMSMDFHSNRKTAVVINQIHSSWILADMPAGFLVYHFCEHVDMLMAFVWIPLEFGLNVAILMLCLSITYIWTSAVLDAWASGKHQAADEFEHNINQTLYESIFHWDSIVNFNRQAFAKHRYASALEASKSVSTKRTLVEAIDILSKSLQKASILSASMIIALMEIKAGETPFKNIITVVTYWDQLLEPLNRFSDSRGSGTAMVASSEALLKVLDELPSVLEDSNAIKLVTEAKTCVIRFCNVQFGYDPKKMVLRDISLEIKPGTKVAIVGETGSGKSTLSKLLLRHYDVFSGVISIKGQDVRGVTISSLRDMFGLVPQTPKLFNATILENVRFARLDATIEQVYAACKTAAIHEKVVSFPDGYETVDGEEGIKLSGGELQRIAIARVLLKNPRVVLLDEATSSVDFLTEHQIQEAFRSLKDGRMVLAIAHRLSTITDADTILVMDQGQITERGTHKQLLGNKGKYFEMWMRQTESDGAP